MSSRKQHFGVMGVESRLDRLGMGTGDLAGCPAVDRDGHRIGRIADVWVDDAGEPRYLGIATGALGTRQVTVPLDDVDVTEIDGERTIVLPYEHDRLGRAPAHDPAEDITVGREREIYGHYGRPGYWEIVDERQSTPSPTPEIARADAAEGTPEAIRAGDVAARQTEPAPTPEIAMAEVEDAVRRGDDPRLVRVKRFGT